MGAYLGGLAPGPPLKVKKIVLIFLNFEHF